MLIDTHAHIHFDDYAGEVDQILENARQAGVDKIICVGVDEADSSRAVELADRHDNLWSTVGLHPHHADRGKPALDKIAELARRPKVMGIGECGLDYFRNLSSPKDQEAALRFQIELGLELNKPMIFHVRDAFDDFFRIFDSYAGVQGLVHCFTSNRQNMEGSVERGLYVALNGIMTFTKDPDQLAAAKHLPLDRMLLETDCPFLTPAPLRGQRNEPANTKLTAEFLAKLRGESLERLSDQTSRNAEELLDI